MYPSNNLGVVDGIQLKEISAGDSVWEAETKKKIADYYFESRRKGFEGSW